MAKPRSALRQFLDLLKRDDLVALSDKIGLPLTQKREVETIRLEMWSRRTKIAADLTGALASLAKPTLAGLCQAFELEVSSHHKESLISTLADFLRNPDDYEYVAEGEVAEEDEEEEEPAELTADEQALLRKVPADGASIGNGRLRRELDWREGKYWKTRDSLVEKGYLALGFGRGGSVYRIGDDESEEDVEDEDVEDDPRESDIPSGYDSSEERLYAPILQMLKDNWQQLFPGFPAPTKHWVDSSPRQGRRMTGGRWTRPDLSAVTLNKYRYIPGPHLEVFSFEVKPRGQFNILGLYEALGHSRRANFAYVLFHVTPEGELRPNQQEDHNRKLEEIKREAARLKVGFATFEDPTVADTWTVHVVPGRHSPEARLLNDFIENLPETIRKEIEFSI
jgi:hypothetical protein